MQNLSKTAVIDIDNTLWQFCDPFYEQLKKANKAFPAPKYWTNWNFYEKYCSETEFLDAINYIHLHQDHDDHLPYSDAKDFLNELKKNNYFIIIASHRSPEYKPQTANWLSKHSLTYDSLHLSFNKTDLFNTSTEVVVDDAPHILEKAVENGALGAGLSFPWNKVHGNNGYPFFDNLNEVLTYILSS